jgi:seipin
VGIHVLLIAERDDYFTAKLIPCPIYSNGINPYGFVSLGSSIVAQQSYDIKLELDLPRSPPNLQAGNFMLDMVLLSPTYQPVVQSAEAGFDIRGSIPSEAVLLSSRRPAILTYHPRLVSLSKQVAALPWYILGWRRDAEKLEIPMAEGVSFRKGWRNVPALVYLELQGKGQDIQVYDVQLKLRARYEGIRWLMYNHRIFSFVIFTTAFWFAEVIFAILTWMLWNSQSGSGKEKGQGELKGEDTDVSTIIKTERENGELETDDLDLSDTPRSFPTYGRQPPLQYVPRVKTEGDGERLVMDETMLQPFAAEADDESEEPVDVGSFRGGRSDSGLGTSFSEGGASLRGGVQRRRSRGGKG